MFCSPGLPGILVMKADARASPQADREERTSWGVPHARRVLQKPENHWFLRSLRDLTTLCKFKGIPDLPLFFPKSTEIKEEDSS